MTGRFLSESQAITWSAGLALTVSVLNLTLSTVPRDIIAAWQLSGSPLFSIVLIFSYMVAGLIAALCGMLVLTVPGGGKGRLGLAVVIGAAVLGLPAFLANLSTMTAATQVGWLTVTIAALAPVLAMGLYLAYRAKGRGGVAVIAVVFAALAGLAFVLGNFGLENYWALLPLAIAALVLSSDSLTARAKPYFWIAIAAWILPLLVYAVPDAVAALSTQSVSSRMQDIAMAFLAQDPGVGPQSMTHLGSWLLVLGVIIGLRQDGPARGIDWAIAGVLGAVVILSQAWGLLFQITPFDVLSTLQLFSNPVSELIAAVAAGWFYMRWQS